MQAIFRITRDILRLQPKNADCLLYTSFCLADNLRHALFDGIAQFLPADHIWTYSWVRKPSSGLVFARPWRPLFGSPPQDKVPDPGSRTALSREIFLGCSSYGFRVGQIGSKSQVHCRITMTIPAHKLFWSCIFSKEYLPILIAATEKISISKGRVT